MFKGSTRLKEAGRADGGAESRRRVQAFGTQAAGISSLVDAA
jgi:hypothetical protein